MMKKVRLYLILPMMLLFGSGSSLLAQCEFTHIQLAGGGEVTTTCPGDSKDDIVDVENNGTGINEYAYIATDGNNTILAVNMTSSFNFEGAGVGTCYVWGLNYTGNITAQMGDDLFSVPLADGCYRLSINRLTINRTNPEGGTIQNVFGDNNVFVCTTDPYSDFLAFQKNTPSNSPYTYVITDGDNNIITNTDNPNFDFSGVPPGICRIWGLSYQGNLTLTPGDNAAASDLSDDCFDLSDNFIEVTRYDVDGGTVADGNGDTALTICAGDDSDDVITFTHQNNSSSSYSYIVTDENNIVLGLPPGNSLDFNGAGGGICRVWGLSFIGDRTVFAGDNIMGKSLATGCYDLSENFIEVTRTGVDGGEVSTPDGATLVYTCPGDGVVDNISFVHTTSTNANYAYVITDATGNILGLPTGGTQNFEGAGAGTCLVWGLSYTGNLLAQVGDNALEINLSDDCYDLSSNFITVERDTPEGGTVSTVDGEDLVYTCPGNGINDIIEFMSAGTSNSNFTYVITDENNVILGVPPGNSQNFDGAGSGICRVWGLAYTGEIVAQIGDNAAFTTLTSTGCFDLSDNFVTVIREQPAAGTLSYNGENVVYTCPGDGMDDIVDFTATDFNQDYQLVITDEDYNILGLPSSNSQNFEGAGVGVCLAWGVSYSGDVLAMMGDNIFSSQFSSDCWSFSDPVRVVRDVPDGGTIQNNSGMNDVTVCTTDGNADVISYNHTTSSTSAYVYLITDADNTILGMTSDPDFNFEGVPPGVCRIWGLSYTGILSDALGVDAATTALSSGCFDLSDNFITVNRTDVDGGTVAMPSGATVRYTCAQDGNADVVMFTNTTSSPSTYIYVITDGDNNVLAMPSGDSADVDGAPVGVCRVWGLSYTGDLTLFAGDNLLNKSLSTDCYDLSENFITINRDKPFGGTVSMPSGATERYTCTQDGNPDVVMFTKQDYSNSNYAYIITSPTLEILGVEMNDFHDFDNAPPGTCWVWGLAYTGNIIAQVGDQADQVALTDDCYDLSDNFISVIRDMPNGGTVVTVDGETSVTVTVGDGIDDIIEFASDGTSNSNFTYVITDDQNNILGIPMGNSQNFEGAGVGICRVWGLSYTGSITAGMGDNAAMVDLTDDCFSLSSNFIEVNRMGMLNNPPSNNLVGNKYNNTFTDVKIAPNPARDFVTVQLGKNISVSPTVQLQVMNLQGQVVYSRVYDVEKLSNNSVDLNIQSYDAGVYFLNVQTATETNTQRFVKQ